jgi:hypothetical protein
MKKTLIIIGICSLLLLLPAITAIPNTTSRTIKQTVPPEQDKDLPTPVLDNHDGTFLGALGVIYKDDNDEWVFEASAYLAGGYKLGYYNKLYGYIYNLDEEQVGYLGAVFGNKIILGWIMNMEEEKAPIIGFLFYNDEYFAGRIMSLFGPAPHLWGQYTPV